MRKGGPSGLSGTADPRKCERVSQVAFWEHLSANDCRSVWPCPHTCGDSHLSSPNSWCGPPYSALRCVHVSEQWSLCVTLSTQPWGSTVVDFPCLVWSHLECNTSCTPQHIYTCRSPLECTEKRQPVAPHINQSALTTPSTHGECGTSARQFPCYNIRHSVRGP